MNTYYFFGFHIKYADSDTFMYHVYVELEFYMYGFISSSYNQLKKFKVVILQFYKFK